MPKKFSFNLLRKKRAAAALPPSTTRSTARSTTRPNTYRRPPKSNGANGAVDKKNDKNNDKKKDKRNKFGKNDGGPGGFEIKTSVPATSASGHVHDEVSVITPVTGLPPDSPGRLRNLPSLLPPPPPSRPLGSNSLYPGTYDVRTPSKGNMRIEVPARGGSGGSQSDVSAMSTPVGTSQRPRSNPPRPRLLLGEDDDDESRELTVYEDGDGDRSSNGGGTPTGSKKKLWKKIKRSSLNKSSSLSGVSPRGRRENNTKSNSKRGGLNRQTSKLIKRSKRSWFTKTDYFQRAIDSTFDMIDADRSGDVTLEELYAGLLLIHLQLAAYAGAPACRPAGKEYVTEIFLLMDTDNSGTLNKEEFTTVMKILYSQVFTRIIIQWGLTLMIVPVISQYIIEYATSFYWMAHEFWKGINDGIDPIELQLRKAWALLLYLTPWWMDAMGEFLWTSLCRVPKGVWRSVPLTMLTLAQTSVALPFAIHRVEDFFLRAARKDVGKKHGSGRS